MFGHVVYLTNISEFEYIITKHHIFTSVFSGKVISIYCWAIATYFVLCVLCCCSQILHVVLLQEKKLLDLPKLFDICAIYNHENEELTKLLVRILY